MAGRPRKPTALALLDGSARKNPQRYRDRIVEPAVPDAPAVGGPPEKWMIFFPAYGHQKAEKLRAVWDNCLKLWPWLEYSDRDALEDYCRWKLELDEGRKLSGAELSAMIRIRSEFGGTGAGRAKRGIASANPGARAEMKPAADPRDVFLARRYTGT